MKRLFYYFTLSMVLIIVSATSCDHDEDNPYHDLYFVNNTDENVIVDWGSSLDNFSTKLTDNSFCTLLPHEKFFGKLHYHDYPTAAKYGLFIYRSSFLQQYTLEEIRQNKLVDYCIPLDKSFYDKVKRKNYTITFPQDIDYLLNN